MYYIITIRVADFCFSKPHSLLQNYLDLNLYVDAEYCADRLASLSECWPVICDL